MPGTTHQQVIDGKRRGFGRRGVLVASALMLLGVVPPGCGGHESHGTEGKDAVTPGVAAQQAPRPEATSQVDVDAEGASQGVAAKAVDSAATPAGAAGEQHTAVAASDSGSTFSPAEPDEGETVATSAAAEVPATFEQAQALYRQGKYADAADAFLAITTQRPDDVWAHYMLGLSAWKAGRLDSAEAALRTALEQDPTHLKSRVNLVRVLLARGNRTEARSQAEQLHRLAPRSPDANVVLGRAYQALKRNQEAIRAYEQAISLDGNDAWAMNNLGLLYIQQSRFGEALPLLARAVQLQPHTATFQNNLGIALERCGYYRTATAAYAAAVAADAGHPRAAANLARVRKLPVKDGRTEPDLAELAARLGNGTRTAERKEGGGLTGAGQR